EGVGWGSRQRAAMQSEIDEHETPLGPLGDQRLHQAPEVAAAAEHSMQHQRNMRCLFIADGGMMQDEGHLDALLRVLTARDSKCQPRPAGASAWSSSLLDSDNHVDFDARAERQACHAHGGTRMPTGLAQHCHQELGGAVDHEVLLGKARVAVYITADPENAVHPLERSQLM